MDAKTEKLCFDEISHLICDTDAKVTIKEVSNNWNISLKESEVVLSKWLKEYDGNRKISKDFLIRGVDLNGNCVISVVPERKLEALERVCPKYCSSLYSLELASNSGRRLDIPKVTESKIISLPLESEKRACKVRAISVPEVKKESTFKSEPSTSTSKPNLFGSAPVKKEKTSPDVKPSTNTTSPSNGVAIKEEKKSPVKKESPKKKDAPKGAKIASGRSAISSFFASKPAAKPSGSAPVKTEPTEEPKKTEAPNKIEASKKTEAPKKSEAPKAKVEVVKKEEDSKPTAESSKVKKRTLSETHTSDSDIPGTPQEKVGQTKKKLKTDNSKAKVKAASNRSRILQICDSSSDDEDTAKGKNGMHGKKEATPDSDEDEPKKEKENTTPEKKGNHKMETDADDEVPKKRRIKAKRMVTKTYEDEDGFINTVREMEEYSCSEDESAPQPTKSGQNNKSDNQAAEKNKKKVSPPQSKTQKSILTFFTKK